VRLFRLDRMLDVQVLDVPAEVPPEAEPRDVDQGLFRPSPLDARIELEVSTAGRWVAEYYPCDEVTELPDGRLRLSLRTPDTQLVRRLALRLGGDGKVTGPPEVVAQIAADAEAALAQYA